MKPALQYLDVDTTDISKEGGQYDAKHFLLYYYYGGMIYTALKKYDRALYFYEVVRYKLFILVQYSVCYKASVTIAIGHLLL